MEIYYMRKFIKIGTIQRFQNGTLGNLFKMVQYSVLKMVHEEIYSKWYNTAFSKWYIRKFIQNGTIQRFQNGT